MSGADSRATRNAESLTNATGEFNPKKAPSKPLTTTGHKPGVQASPADHAPEFSAKTAPPGTAPSSNTFTPNPSGDDAIPGQADNPNLSSTSGGTAALDMPGATSGDVSTGMGHPGDAKTEQSGGNK